jgi:tRNA modification GTPase
VLVISGPANAGKSTLLNHLLGRSRAIVSPQPGTTRDTIEESIIIDGIPVRLIDTAGLRATGCEIEQEGIMRSENEIQRADIHLLVLDSSQDLDASLRQRIDRDFNPKRTLVILNKTDLPRRIHCTDFPRHECLETCLLDDVSIDDIRQRVRSRIESDIDFSAPPHAVISERHRELLVDASSDLTQAATLLQDDPEGNMVPAATHLRAALEALGTVTGRVYGDELLDSIFSRFCIGK